MNIAICFSGGIRYPENGILSIDQIKNGNNNHDIKVFAHTWNIPDKEKFLKSTHRSKDKNPNKSVVNNFNVLCEYNFESLLIENYSSKEIEFGNIFNSLNFKSYSNTNISTLSMHYSIFKCNKLKMEYEKKNKIVFDYVIRLRYDSFIVSSINFNDYSNYDICIPFGSDWGGSKANYGEGGINDQFAIGTSKSMDLYSNLFNVIDQYTNTDYHPETLFRHYISNQNLKINRIPLLVEINNGEDFRKNYSVWDVDHYMSEFSPDYQLWWKDEYLKYDNFRKSIIKK